MFSKNVNKQSIKVRFEVRYCFNYAFLVGECLYAPNDFLKHKSFSLFMTMVSNIFAFSFFAKNENFTFLASGSRQQRKRVKTVIPRSILGGGDIGNFEKSTF